MDPANIFECKVISLEYLTPNVYALRFTPDHPLVFKAGQYISVEVPDKEGKVLRRPYSIASGPEEEVIELCVQRIEDGPGSNYLANLKPGDTFKGVAPFGFLTYHPAPTRHALFIATGTGIAPFRSIFKSSHFQTTPPLSTKVLFGVRHTEDLFYTEDFKKFSNLEHLACLSKPKDSNQSHFCGRVTTCLNQMENSISWENTEFYICGNGVMIDEVRALLKSKGVDRKSIHVEVYFRPTATA